MTTDDADSSRERDKKLVKYFLDEVEAACKREKGFRESGVDLSKDYEAGRSEETRFNILFSNTETLAPALYNSTPKPVVKRRFTSDESPAHLQASIIGQRLLAYLLDDGLDQQVSFDEFMEQAVLEGLVPGRGVLRVRYQAEFEQIPAPLRDEVLEGKEEEPPVKMIDKVCYEGVKLETVPWDRFTHGYAKRWEDVPWIEYTHFFTKEELIKDFTLEKLQEARDTAFLGASGPADEEIEEDSEDGPKTRTYKVHEIWHKPSKTIYFVSKEFPACPLKVEEDPLKLSGFYDCPRPLQFVSKISNLTPVALYKTYSTQARELNLITARIDKLVSALRIRGLYDNTVAELTKLMEAGDNEMLPVSNVATLMAMQGGKGGLDQAVWFYPIKDLVPVLQTLYAQRNQVKQVIYEITGIADIMRGSSQASETLGAQELKNQWGTLRLKRHQRRVARFVRDTLRIMLEVAVGISPEKIRAMVGVDLPTQAELTQQQELAQQQAIANPVAQPVPPPSGPTLEEVLSILQNDVQRSYKIDIETNSTVDEEATEDKKNVGEFMNALSQFLNGVGPLVENGTLPFEVAQSMMLSISRKFRFGDEVETQLKSMKPPQPRGDPKAGLDKAMADAKMQELKLNMEARQQEHGMRMLEMREQHRIRMEELAVKAAQLALKPEKAPDASV